MITGYICALISSLFFTAYVIPKKLSKQTPIKYSLFMGLGFFIVSIIMFIINKITVNNSLENLANPILLLSALGGILWLIGSVFFLSAIDKIGLSRSNQWKNLQGPVGAILTLTFLSEFMQTKVVYIILAVIFILLSAMLFTIRKREEQILDKKGIIWAILSAIFFGINALIQKFATNNGLIYAQQVYFSASVFISALVYIGFKEKSIIVMKDIKSKQNILGIIGGITYYFASFFSTLAYKYIPGSIAFTIVQLNAVWTVLVGILMFKEINFKKNWLRILTGMVFAIIGVIMLLFAQK